MKDFDAEKQGGEIDTSHSIKLVASVSYDRKKKEFNYDKFDATTFGAGS